MEETVGYHLQFWDSSQNAWSYVKTTYVYYEENGKQYPAYCLQKNLPGVGESDEYVVNIDELINDVRIWRTAINGYPYQTPTAMGLENKFDAFVATKQAIYCILYGTDPSTSYNGPDSRGQAIKNAIIKLVDIGRNGTQTPVNVNITANKVGSFIEDGDFYMQEFSITAPVETSQYTITATNGLPEGSQITNMSNNIQNTFGGNEHFKVKIPKSQLTKDINYWIQAVLCFILAYLMIMCVLMWFALKLVSFNVVLDKIKHPANGQKGIDVVKILTFGIMNFDTEISGVRLFTCMMLLCMLFAVIVVI